MALSRTTLRNSFYDGSEGILTNKYDTQDMAQVPVDWGNAIGGYISGLTVAALSPAQRSTVKTATVAALSGMLASQSIADFSGVISAGCVAAAGSVAAQGSQPPLRTIVPPTSLPTSALIAFFTSQLAIADSGRDTDVILSDISEGLSTIIDTWAKTGTFTVGLGGGTWV